jgi:hypothetical protein
VVLSAFDRSTRLLPFLFYDTLMFPAGAGAIANALNQAPTSGSRELPRRVIHIGVKGGEHLAASAHHLMADTWCRVRPHRRCWPARPDLGGLWPSRLVATAAADCLRRHMRRLRRRPMVRLRALLSSSQRPLSLWKQTDK